MKYLVFALTLCLAACMPLAVAFAQEVVEAAATVCVDGLGGINELIILAITSVVAICSAVANVVPKKGIGKLIHFLAVNLTVDKVPKAK